MTQTPHPVYNQVLTDNGETWTHPPNNEIPVLTARPGPVTANGKQLLMITLVYPNGETIRREIAYVGDRPPEAKTLAFKLNPLLGADYEQAFNRIANLEEGKTPRPEDLTRIDAITLYRNVIAAALYDLAKPAPTQLHIIRNPQELQTYINTLDPILIRLNHLDYPIEIGAKGEKTLIHGATSEGKSWFALWLAAKLAEQQKRTAFLLTEGGKYGAARVQKTWQKLVPQNTAPHPIIIVPFGQTHLDPERIQTIQKELAQNDVDVIILDVLSPLMIDENSAGEYNSIRNILTPLTEDRFFVEVHHHNKAAGKPRGTGRIVDDAAYDLIVKTSKTGNPLMIPGNKSRGTTRTDWAVALNITAGYPQEQAPAPPPED